MCNIESTNLQSFTNIKLKIILFIIKYLKRYEHFEPTSERKSKDTANEEYFFKNPQM